MSFNKIINYIEEFVPIEKLKSKKVILFGAGLDGKIAFDFFSEKGIDVLYYCDNNKEKQGTFLNGIEIISPEKLKNIHSKKDIIIFITIKMQIEQIKEQLQLLDLDYLVFSDYMMRYSLSKNLDKYRYVYDNILTDDKSKEIYVTMIISRLKGNSLGMKNLCDEEDEFYALPEFKNLTNECFVDAGAYVGDTLEKFIWKSTGRFKKIYAFEPGIKQYRAMLHRVDRLKKEWALDDTQIECIHAGLSDENDKLRLNEENKDLLTTSFIISDIVEGNNTYEVDVYSIDSYLKDKEVTMIKADIEGYEMNMLKGSINIIQSQKPKLAISIYHKYEDLFEIPIYINEIMPLYKMAIRHHSTNLTETVLYCWI